MQFSIFGEFFQLCLFCGSIKDEVNSWPWVFIAVTLNGLIFNMQIYTDHLQNWLDFRHQLLIFFILVGFWLGETGQICDFQAFLRMRGSYGLKFDMLMYPDHFQNWLYFGHSLLIFHILATFWLREVSETGQIWGFQGFPLECMGGIA